MPTFQIIKNITFFQTYRNDKNFSFGKQIRFFKGDFDLFLPKTPLIELL